MLANVYLHYVLDDLFSKVVKPNLKGESYLVRFADDFIIMFQYENEAQEVYQRLKERFLKFGLELADDKTRILPFGRHKGGKDTFDFLGFKHYNSKTRLTNKYTVGHKISLKKLTFKWSNKRSQRRSYEWDEFNTLWNRFINKPRIYKDIWGWNQSC